MNKVYGLVFIFFVSVNVFSCVIILPAAQKSINSHLGSGRVWAVGYYMVAFLILVAAINQSRKLNDLKVFLLLFTAALSVALWGYKLSNLYCMGCMNSG